MDLVTRRCLKADCPRTFNVSPGSSMRYCSREHDPNPPPMKEHKTWDPEVRRRLIEMLKEGLKAKKSREEMSVEVRNAGFRTPYGRTITAQHISNILCYEGLTNRRKKKNGTA